jgi:hypothetical protein
MVPISQTDRDFAEFAQLGLRFGLLTPANVRGWADRVIADRHEPPSWAIELAVADLNEMISWLNSVPGHTSPGGPINLVLGLMWHEWRSGSLSLQRVRDIGRQWSMNDQLPLPADGGDWGAVLDCLYEEFEQGYRSEAKLRAFVSEALGPYEAYAGQAAEWAG